jgi:hypothetical protein
MADTRFSDFTLKIELCDRTRLGQGCRTGVLRVTQMPDDASTDERGEVHLLCQAAAVLFIRQELCGQRQPIPRQHRDPTLLTEGPDQTVESHGRGGCQFG